MTTSIQFAHRKNCQLCQLNQKYLAQKARHDNIKSSIFHFSFIHSPKEKNNIMKARETEEEIRHQYVGNGNAILFLNDDFETNVI